MKRIIALATLLDECRIAPVSIYSEKELLIRQSQGKFLNPAEKNLVQKAAEERRKSKKK